MTSPTKENCLATNFPLLIKEWNVGKNSPMTPYNVTYASHKSVFWKCKNNHEWKSNINNRSTGQQSCPYCTGRKVNKENCLLSKKPKLSKEWNYKKNKGLMPSDVVEFSNKNVWWICKNNHEWQDTIGHRSNENSHRGCPYCSGRRTTFENNLAIKRPDLIKEWDFNKNTMDPKKVALHSGKKAFWKCHKGHKWDARISSRTCDGFGCPYCSGNKVSNDNNLYLLYPELASEWHPTKNGNLNSTDVSKGSEKKVWWKCNKGHEWKANISSRVRGNNCPYCKGILLKGNVLCDSIPDAIKYIEYKELGLSFKYNKKYGNNFGKRRYDFFFPLENKYVEVTSYNNNISIVKSGMYFSYLRKIIKKRRFVQNVLKAKFEFIQFIPTKGQIKKVRKWTK